MLRKIGRKLINNIGLKILAALFAIVLWIVVVNIDDPISTSDYTTSIIFENQNYLASKNKYFEIMDGNNTIKFVVTAQRSIHEKLSNTDFKAVADMEKIEYDEAHDIYRVPVVVTQSKYGGDKVTIATKNLYTEVMLEDLGKAQKPILATTTGTVADGCALGGVTIEGSNIVKIQGPSSIVNRVDKVVAAINVDGMSTDLTDSVVPIFYDEDEEVIDTTKLKLSVSMVSIHAKILNTKDVSLEFSTKGTVAEGYVVTGIDFKPNTVRIKGEAATLNLINKISIPEEVLDLTDATESIKTTVDITSYLPEGTYLVLNSDAKVNVTVKIEPVVKKMVEVPVSNLTVGNLGTGQQAEFMTETVVVEVFGAESEMEKLHAGSIKGIADASGIGNGEHQLEVTFDFGDLDCSQQSSVKVPVTVTGEVPDTSPEEEGVTDTGEPPEMTDTGENASDDTAEETVEENEEE